MATVNTRYVTWISRGRRHHGSSSSDISPALSTTFASPGTYQAWAPASISVAAPGGSSELSFLFWSVTGAANGPTVTTDPSLSVNVGSSDVSATAWYVAAGGGGDGGGPGVFIDAFDVNIGNFVDDDFVSVAPDSGLTAAANNDGFVPTNSAEVISAFPSIHAVPFEGWTLFAGAEAIAGVELNADANTSAIAFAFYKNPTGVIVVPRVPNDSTWVSWGVKVDGGGPTGRGPVPPWNPFVMELAAGLVLAETAALVRRDLRADVLKLSAEQVKSAADTIVQRILKSEK